MTLFRCTASGLQPSGRPWSIRLHFSSTSSVASVNTSWTAAVSDLWTNGTYGADLLFPPATTVTEAKTEELTVVTIGAVDKLRSVAQTFSVLALAGTSPSPGLPDQNVVLVSLRTATPGREGRGRIHLPGPREDLVTAGLFSSTYATRVSTACAAVRTAMAAAGHVQAVVTYAKTKAGTPVGSFRVVNLEETDEVVRTLRGRVKSRKAIYV